MVSFHLHNRVLKHWNCYYHGLVNYTNPVEIQYWKPTTKPTFTIFSTGFLVAAVLDLYRVSTGFVVGTFPCDSNGHILFHGYSSSVLPSIQLMEWAAELLSLSIWTEKKEIGEEIQYPFDRQAMFPQVFEWGDFLEGMPESLILLCAMHMCCILLLSKNLWFMLNC